MSQQNYEAKDILVLEGLDAVRLRPGMYIGTTGQKGLHHLLWEIVDNSIDEISNGFGDTITIELNKDGSATVTDNGRGIPVDEHPTAHVSAVQVVFTELHAGGKFNNSNYSYSGGLHGVGASVTNALSRWLNVTVCKNKQKYYMEFESYEASDGKIKSGIPKAPLKMVGATQDRGTKVSFLPDSRVFGDLTFDFAIIAKRAEELAYLNKGLKIELTDNRTDKKVSYQYNGGIKDFLLYIDKGKNRLFSDPIYYCVETDVLKAEVVLEYTDGYTENCFSFVNNIPTTEGGTHETGFKSGLTKIFNDYAREHGYLKEKDANLLGEDYREGLSVIIAVKMKSVQFEGQTKTKLGNPEARTELESITIKELTKFFKDKSNEKIADVIINKAKGAAKSREAAKHAKEITRAKNSADNFNLVGKFASCSSRKSELCELFIVEGDSAGGTAKEARDRKTQAILPLRGKPLNAEKKRIDQVLANEEIQTIISALETGIQEDFNINALRYGKVVILSDADQDGLHIRSILLTFFYRYMKGLITAGNVFVGLPPLYRVFKKGFSEYVYSDLELPDAIARCGKGYDIQRYKGLGEMNADELWDTTMDPEKRTLVQVTIEDAAQAEKMVTVWMGDNIEARKEYISLHANFDRTDKFEEEYSDKLKK